VPDNWPELLVPMDSDPDKSPNLQRQFVEISGFLADIGSNSPVLILLVLFLDVKAIPIDVIRYTLTYNGLSWAKSAPSCPPSSQLMKQTNPWTYSGSRLRFSGGPYDSFLREFSSPRSPYSSLFLADRIRFDRLPSEYTNLP
jgi:hypothetical protein